MLAVSKGRELTDEILHLHWFLGTWCQFIMTESVPVLALPYLGDKNEKVTNCHELHPDLKGLGDPCSLTWPSTWATRTSHPVYKPVAASLCGFCLLRLWGCFLHWAWTWEEISLRCLFLCLSYTNDPFFLCNLKGVLLMCICLYMQRLSTSADKKLVTVITSGKENWWMRSDLFIYK